MSSDADLGENVLNSALDSPNQKLRNGLLSKEPLEHGQQLDAFFLSRGLDSFAAGAPTKAVLSVETLSVRERLFHSLISK